MKLKLISKSRSCLNNPLLVGLCVLLPASLFGGWSQEITGGPEGDDVPATVESPKLYSVGSEALPFDSTELPVMYPEDRLWFDVRDKNRVLREYIREVVNNRYLNLHQWERSPDYFASEPKPGKLNRDYLRAVHARMAFFSKLLQMPYTAASEESHANANTSIMWADYNDMVDLLSLWLSNGEGISYPGWVHEEDKPEFWESHYPDMNTNLISGPGIDYDFPDAADYVSIEDLPIDPVNFIILGPQNTRSMAHELSLLWSPVWSLSNTRDTANAHALYGALPEDRVDSPFKPLAYYTNKSYPFMGHTPSTLVPNTWYFTTGWTSTKEGLVLDEETQEWTTSWEPNILMILSSSQWELLDSDGNPLELYVRHSGNMVGFTALNEQGNAVNLGRGIPNGEVRSFTVRGQLLLEVQWMKEGEESYIEEIPYNVEYAVHIIGTEQLDYVVWPNEEQVNYDIKYTPEWGKYNTAQYPWIWRYDTSDWVYMVDFFLREDHQKIYFYSPDEQTWVYITSESAPYAYHYGEGTWIVY